MAAHGRCAGLRSVAGVAVVRADDRRVRAARARIAGVVRAHVAIIAVGRGPAGAETVRAGVAGRAGVRVVARAPVGHRLVDATEHGIAAVRSAGVGIDASRRLEGLTVEIAGRAAGRIALLGELHGAVAAGGAGHEAAGRRAGRGADWLGAAADAGCKGRRDRVRAVHRGRGADRIVRRVAATHRRRRRAQRPVDGDGGAADHQVPRVHVAARVD